MHCDVIPSSYLIAYVFFDTLITVVVVLYSEMVAGHWCSDTGARWDADGNLIVVSRCIVFTRFIP